MKTKEFGAWSSGNEKSGGQRSSFDEYNRSFKGDPYNLAYKKERYPSSPEYASSGINEYNRYPETKDYTKDDDDQQSSSAASVASAAAAKAKSKRSSRMRVMQQLVAIVAGATIITATYQAMINTQANADEPDKPAVVDNSGDQSGDDNTPTDDHDTDTSTPPTDTSEPDTSEPQTSEPETSEPENDPLQIDEDTFINWNWSNNGADAVLVFTDSNGDIISEITADVTTAEKAASCTADGEITYTASAEADGETYTDIRREVLPALGHSFGDGEEITLDDGQTAVEYICDRCNEHFVIKNSVTEE